MEAPGEPTLQNIRGLGEEAMMIAARIGASQPETSGSEPTSGELWDMLGVEPLKNKIVKEMSSFVAEKEKRTGKWKEGKSAYEKGYHEGFHQGEEDAFDFEDYDDKTEGDFGLKQKSAIQTARDAFKEGYAEGYKEVKTFTTEQGEEADKQLTKIEQALATGDQGKASEYWKDIFEDEPPEWEEGQPSMKEVLQKRFFVHGRHTNLSSIPETTGRMSTVDSTFVSSGTTVGLTPGTDGSEREFFHATVPFGANESQQLGESDAHWEARMQRLEERDDELFDVDGSERVRVDQKDQEEARDEYEQKIMEIIQGST